MTTQQDVSVKALHRLARATKARRRFELKTAARRRRIEKEVTEARRQFIAAAYEVKDD